MVILEGYGLSETSAIATFNESAENRRVLSIGRPMWGVEVKVVDDDGAELERGEDHIGEIVIRGHNVMKGYYGRPEATAEALRGGWFHTGDLGYRDEDGYFFIVDRVKDMIIRGGFNVYPREIEEVLFAHPAIAEAAVIGKPDDRLGEEVVAVVSLKPGASATPEEVVAYAKEQLAAYKYPPRGAHPRRAPEGADREDPQDRAAGLTPSGGQPVSLLRDDWLEPRPDRLDVGVPDRQAILAAHRSAVDAGDAGYLDPRSGLFVLAATYLAERGYCCDQGCRHCPYEPAGPDAR